MSRVWILNIDYYSINFLIIKFVISLYKQSNIAYLWKVFLAMPLETGVNVSWKGQNAEIVHIQKRGDDEKAALINY